MAKILKAIWKFIISIPADKWMHFVAGAFIALFVFAPFTHCLSKYVALAIGNAASVVALVLKEVYDSKHEGHTVEMLDVVAGLCGMVLVDIAVLLMKVQ